MHLMGVKAMNEIPRSIGVPPLSDASLRHALTAHAAAFLTQGRPSSPGTFGFLYQPNPTYSNALKSIGGAQQQQQIASGSGLMLPPAEPASRAESRVGQMEQQGEMGASSSSNSGIQQQQQQQPFNPATSLIAELNSNSMMPPSSMGMMNGSNGESSSSNGTIDPTQAFLSNYGTGTSTSNNTNNGLGGFGAGTSNGWMFGLGGDSEGPNPLAGMGLSDDQFQSLLQGFVTGDGPFAWDAGAMQQQQQAFGGLRTPSPGFMNLFSTGGQPIMGSASGSGGDGTNQNGSGNGEQFGMGFLGGGGGGNEFSQMMGDTSGLGGMGVKRSLQETLGGWEPNTQDGGAGGMGMGSSMYDQGPTGLSHDVERERKRGRFGNE